MCLIEGLKEELDQVCQVEAKLYRAVTLQELSLALVPEILIIRDTIILYNTITIIVRIINIIVRIKYFVKLRFAFGYKLRHYQVDYTQKNCFVFLYFS